MSSYLFTSESVSEGHPDKVADQISDAVLDAILVQDKRARVACETLVKTGVAIVAGEVTTSAWVDLEALARKVIVDIGYNSSEVGFDGATCGILNLIGKQSPDIAQGVDRKAPEEQGAGRPGPDVRLRVQRDEGVHAGGDLLRASARRAAGESAQAEEVAAAVAAPRREEPGHAALRERRRGRHRRGRALDAARSPPVKHKDLREAVSSTSSSRCCRRSGSTRCRPQDPHQPDRQVRDRRPGGRLRPHRPQDHRRLLRRLGAPRRRRVLRQGPVQGRPFRGVRRALRREEHRRRGGWRSAARSR
jgi:hypothetical protein